MQNFERRFYWTSLPLLSVWEKRGVLGVGHLDGIMYDSLYFVGAFQHNLLLLNWRHYFGFAWMLCCMLCLWLSKDIEIKVQSSGSHLCGFAIFVHMDKIWFSISSLALLIQRERHIWKIWVKLDCLKIYLQDNLSHFQCYIHILQSKLPLDICMGG